MQRAIACLLVVFAPFVHAQCDEYPLRLEIFSWLEDAQRPVKLADIVDGGTVHMSHRAADSVNIRAVYRNPDAFKSEIRVIEDAPGGFRGDLRTEFFVPWTAFSDKTNIVMDSKHPWRVSVQFYDHDNNQLVNQRISFTLSRAGVPEKGRILVESDPAMGIRNVEDTLYLLDPDEPRLLAHDLTANQRDSDTDVLLHSKFLAENWLLVNEMFFDPSDDTVYIVRQGKADPEEDIYYHRFTPDGSMLDFQRVGKRLPAWLDLLGIRNGGQFMFFHENAVRSVVPEGTEDSDFDDRTLIWNSRILLELGGEVNFDAAGFTEVDGTYYVSDPLAARVFAYNSSGYRLVKEDIHERLVAYGNTRPMASFVYNGTLYVSDIRFYRVYKYPLGEAVEDDDEGDDADS